MPKRKCKHCSAYSEKWVKQPVGTFCTEAHMFDWLAAKREKAKAKQMSADKKKVAEVKRRARRDTKLRKDKAKTLSQWLNEAQAVVNSYVRLRDIDKPCICCDRHHQGQYHAGHFLSRGAHPELRFNLWNIHKQASYCNSYKSGNQQQYRIKLVEKIGQDKVDWLEGPHSPAKFTVEYAKRIKQIFSKKKKRLERAISKSN